MAKKKKDGNNRYITTHGDLKEFASQVNNNVFPDQKFQKAYERFKRPAYQMRGE